MNIVILSLSVNSRMVGTVCPTHPDLAHSKSLINMYRVNEQIVKTGEDWEGAGKSRRLRSPIFTFFLKPAELWASETLSGMATRCQSPSL